MSAPAHACFGMYPFQPLRPAWDALVAAMSERVPWVPAGLDWSEDVHDSWRDRECVLGHACGWPVAVMLTDHVRVVGAFELAADWADGHRYRSVLVAADGAELGDLVARAVRVAANSVDSLSGWISLLVGTGSGSGWPGEVLRTGAHAQSLRAVREGRADLAAIDALSLAQLRRIDPHVCDGVAEVGQGPWIPSPAVVVRLDATDRQVDEVRAAFHDVLGDPSFAWVRERLMIGDFVDSDGSEYAELPRRWPHLC